MELFLFMDGGLPGNQICTGMPTGVTPRFVGIATQSLGKQILVVLTYYLKTVPLQIEPSISC